MEDVFIKVKNSIHPTKLIELFKEKPSKMVEPSSFRLGVKDI